MDTNKGFEVTGYGQGKHFIAMGDDVHTFISSGATS
jgi:hypothetical protein